ncbi:ras guanine nucleotide exchange factor R-like [Diabrotica virgifera virgifera]|uniref:Uncharacterized protein n=1 Tax=Diabrotica virgifera virgifera TaxID=50390 RepID=A0ABM5L2J6_DIAVI|nr:ras guanine nucleotide exchange factor R-like [Diabrotica virgifera virgifera]
MVDSLLHSHKYVNIKETQVEIRRLITPAQRLIISNAGPSVPTTLIEQELRKMSISAVSKMTFLRETECPDYANTITSNATTSNTTNLDSTNSNPPTSNTTNPDPTNSNPTTSKALPETSQNTQYITNLPYNQTEQKPSDKALISTSNDHPASSQNILDQIPDVQVSNNQLESTIETDDMSRPTNNTNETNTLKITTSSTSNKISNLTPLEITQPKIIPNVTKHPKRLILSVVNTFKQPTKDEAIVLSSIEGTKVQEYIIAVGSIVGPRNVSFASRIANNRICIYLSSKNMVDSLLHSHKYVNIKETQVEIRRLITPAQRLIISNAGPSVPTTLIEQELRKMSISAVSKMTFLRETECPDYANTITSNATTSNTTNLDSTNSNPPTSNTTNPDPTNSNPTTSKALPETSQNTQYITNLPYNQTEQKPSDKALISTSNDHPASSQNILDQIPDVQVSNNQLESTIETDDMSRPTNNTNETNTLKITTSSTSNKISNLTPLEITQPKIIPNVTKHPKRLILSSPEINENTTQTDSHIFTSPELPKSILKNNSVSQPKELLI